MRTYKVLHKKVKEYDRDTFDVYEKEVNVYLVQLTEKEYCKAKRIFKEKQNYYEQRFKSIGKISRLYID